MNNQFRSPYFSLIWKLGGNSSEFTQAESVQLRGLQLSPVELEFTPDRHRRTSEKWKNPRWNLFERKGGIVRSPLTCAVRAIALFDKITRYAHEQFLGAPASTG